MSENPLNALPPDWFNGLNLYKLQLYYFSLQNQVFTSMTNLINLYIVHSELSVLPEPVFWGLFSLESLDLQSNKLSSLPSGVFNTLISVRNIYLWKNVLRSLPPRLFNGLIKLSMINLSQNKLSALPSDLLTNLPSLQSVYLQKNRLANIPSGIFKNSTALLFINLSENDLVSVEQLDLPQHRVDLILRDNSIECDRKICWILYEHRNGTLEEHESYYGDIDAKCSTPHEWTNRAMFDLNPQDIDGCTGQSSFSHRWILSSKSPMLLQYRAGFQRLRSFKGGRRKK